MATVYSDVDQNWTALTYVNGDFIQTRRGSTLTINASITGTIADRIQAYEAGTLVHITNTSTTTPIVVNVGVTGSTQMDGTTGAKVLIEGAKISIGTGTGVAGQTFTLPTTDTAANMPLIGGIFSEQGATLRDGTVVPTLHGLVDSTLYGTVINDEKAGDVYTQDTTANTVTFKRAVPNGANVYIPNIFIANNSSHASGGQISTNTNGALSGHDFGVVDGYFYISRTFEDTELDHVVVYSSKTTSLFQAQQSAYGATIKNCILTQDPAGTFTSYPFYSHPIFKYVDARNLRVNSCRSNVLRTATSNSYYEAVIATNSYTGSISSYYPWHQEGGSNVTVRDVTICAPSQMYVNFVKNYTFDNLRLYSAYRTDSTSTYNPNLIICQYSNGVSITNVEELDDSVTGMTARRSNTAFNTPYNTDFYMSDVIITGSSSATSTERWTTILASQGTRCTYQNFTIGGLCNSRTIYSQDQVAGGVYRNIYFTLSQTANTSSRSYFGADAVVDRVSAGTTSTPVDTQPAVEMFDCGSFLLYRDGDTDKTAGFFTQYLNPSLEDPRTVWSGATLTKLEYVRGLAYVRTDPGVDLIITSDVHVGVVGCTATAWALGGLGGTSTFEVRRRDAAWSTPAAFNFTNVNAAIAALPSSADNEVQFRFTLTSITGTNVNSYIGKVDMDLTLDGSDAPSTAVDFEPDSPWNRPTSNHQETGSFGEIVQQIYLNTLNTTTQRAN